MNMDNEATRLHNILEKAACESGVYQVKRVWASVFDLDEKSQDLEPIYRKLFLLHQMLDEVERRIKIFPNISYDVYLKRLANIRKVISLPNLNDRWDKHNHLLNDGVFATLEICAEHLPNVQSEKVRLDEEIECLKMAVESLKEQVLSGGLDHELQNLLLDLLDSMRRALYEYRFRGVGGVRQELFLIFERLQRYYPIFKQHSDEPMVSSFWDVLTSVDTLTSVYLNVPQFLGGISKLLGG
jgi:hypothetical protein